MYGYEVVTASDGQEAAETLRANKHITVLVSDADLAGEIDGLALARFARERNPNIDIIYTSRNPYRLSEKAKVSGAPTLRDPYHPHQLVGVLTHLRYRSSDTVEQSVT
jgi:CheY-like chemotaxis protein